MNTTYKNDLKSYVDLLFNGYPETEELNALHTEISLNVCERFDDMVSDGIDEKEAYRRAMQSIGDIDAMIAEIAHNGKKGAPHSAPAPEADPDRSGEYHSKDQAQTEQEDGQYVQPDEDTVARYKSRNALTLMISIILYILCPVPIMLLQNRIGVVLLFVAIGLATFMIILNDMTKPVAVRADADVREITRQRRFSGICVALAVFLYIVSPALPVAYPSVVGAALLLTVIGVATGLIILQGVRNKGLKHKAAKYESSGNEKKEPRNPLHDTLNSVLWLGTVAVYLLISFNTGRWDITWLCFLIAIAADNLIDSIFKYTKTKSKK